MRQAIKNIPILGKVFILIYETVFKFFHYIRHKLLRNYISKTRWKRIEKELVENFADSADNEIKELLNNIKKQGKIELFNYSFVQKYNSQNIKVYCDENNGYRYVLHQVDSEYEKIYFPLDWSEQQIQTAYNDLLIEQDEESPHCYFNKDFPVPEDAIILDCGVAEGNFSISNVKRAKHIYLFEGSDEWYKPLQLTFDKWKEKVTLIPKYISDIDQESYITLDSWVGGGECGVLNEKVFVKMDIEGYEEKALYGFVETLNKIQEITMAVCSYHRQDSEKNIKDFFEKEGKYKIATSKGYMILNHFCDELCFPYMRKGIVFVQKVL